MKQKFKLSKMMMMIMLAIVTLTLQGCPPDPVPEPLIYTAPSFDATNVSVDGEKKLTASDNKVSVNLNYTVTITINGETQVFTGSCSSNELPVLAGNEVEIVASFDEYSATSNICFTMPDGSREIVSKADPSCRWTVPTNFTAGSKITAQWVDNAGKIQYPNLMTSITIISL